MCPGWILTFFLPPPLSRHSPNSSTATEGGQEQQQQQRPQHRHSCYAAAGAERTRTKNTGNRCCGSDPGRFPRCLQRWRLCSHRARLRWLWRLWGTGAAAMRPCFEPMPAGLVWLGPAVHVAARHSHNVLSAGGQAFQMQAASIAIRIAHYCRRIDDDRVPKEGIAIWAGDFLSMRWPASVDCCVIQTKFCHIAEGPGTKKIVKYAI